MKVTLTAITAEVGSTGGSVRPSTPTFNLVQSEVDAAIDKGLIIDGLPCYTGDDLTILMAHSHGENSKSVQEFGWDTLQKAAEFSKRHGLHKVGHDLIIDSHRTTLRGAGPGLAELSFDHVPSEHRPSESFLLLTSDKTGPAAYNMPLFLAFADALYCVGLTLPHMINGFRFLIVDMAKTDGESVIELNAPEDFYRIAALLRYADRFVITGIYSREYGERAAAVSSRRLSTSEGKDDPTAIVRSEGIFPASEEILSTLTRAHYVGGDGRGSLGLPLMPVPFNTGSTSPYGIPLVSCLGFSLNEEGKLLHCVVDFFNNPAWDYVRYKAQERIIEMRGHSLQSAAMLAYSELERGSLNDTLSGLLGQFVINAPERLDAVSGDSNS